MTTPLQLEALYERQSRAQTAALGHVEIISGVPQEKPTPNRLHVYLAMILEKMLSNESAPFSVLREMNVLFGDDLRVPDLIVLPPGSRFELEILVSTPRLCIEILSPKQSLASLFEKCEFYLRHGVPECWVFLPEKRQAYRYRASDGLSPVDELQFDDKTYRVADIFARLPLD